MVSQKDKIQAGWVYNDEGRLMRPDMPAKTVGKDGLDIDPEVAYHPAFHDNRDIRDTPRGYVREVNAHARDILLKERANERKIVEHKAALAQSKTDMLLMPKDEHQAYINKHETNKHQTLEEASLRKMFMRSHHEAKESLKAAQQEERRAYGDSSLLNTLNRALGAASPEQIAAFQRNLALRVEQEKPNE